MSERQAVRQGFGAKFRRSLPYVLLLCVALFLFRTAGNIEYTVPAARIGPDFWPKLIVILLIVACTYGIASAWTTAERVDSIDDVDSISRKLEAEAMREGTGRRYPGLVGAGVALSISYAWLVDKLGFLLCTFLFLVAFAYIGRYRRHRVILASSLIGSIVLMFVFMRVVYISLPIGTAPFSYLSLAAMKLMGIH